MLTPELIKAARALASWDQQDLADHTGLSKTAIANIETGRHRPTLKNQKLIQDAFTNNSIEFIDDGVRYKKDLIRVYEGEDCYLRFLDDAYYALIEEKGEILFSGSDERRSPEAVVESFRRMRKAGIGMRSLIKEGNTHIMGPLGEYRWVSEKLFTDADVKITYNDTVAFLLSWAETPKVVAIKDTQVAEDAQRTFNFIWDISQQPEKSTSNVFY